VAVTVYRVKTLSSVGVPLMVQVVLSILKPAGSVGAIVQLAIAPPELLKVMSVMVEPITATWFIPFARLGASAVPPVDEEHTVTATNTTGQTATATVSLTTSLIAPTPTPATLTVVATGVPNEITLSWARVTGATAYRVYQTTDATFTQAGNSNPSQFSVYHLAGT
jgi:hypothetical protein